MENLNVKGNSYSLPIYLPDATKAVVKGLSKQDLIDSNVDGVVVNTYHLASKGLIKFGGIKNFMNFEGLVVSDSGGWQVFSLIHRRAGQGKITDDGVIFEKGQKIFTPEDSIRAQFEIGSDIIICLDDFTSPTASNEEIKKSVDRTILWAERCKSEFKKIVFEKNFTSETRPLLFSVIQGHFNKELRSYCANELMKIGFDGYGFGGYPINLEGNLDLEISEYVANLIPEDAYKFALGVGRPWDIAQLYEFGWEIFDCTLPTRDARHNRLYVFKDSPDKNSDKLKSKDFYEYIYINKGLYENDLSPISDFCECPVCKNYSRAYIHHLNKIKDLAYLRLSAVHNLWTYNKVIELLRNQ